MIGRQGEDQAKLFHAFCLEDRVPANHLLRRIDRRLSTDSAYGSAEILVARLSRGVSSLNRCTTIGWRNPQPLQERGFTLLELLVVLAILGLLIGLVAPAVMRQLGSAKEKIAHQSVERLATVLDMYKLDVGTYPTTEQGLQALITQPQGVAHWNGPYLKGDKLPEDPWGHLFVYRTPGQRTGHEYDLYSLGPTGQATGPDDTSAIASQ